ncbi:Panacea domain-containing protein [Bacteroides sp.]|uniref:Panacea domain-containing protein n=1 Tax=Bacteroides sp. TaxID=29523 RepID=UPI0025B9F512|nr:Panacea domain-containing protein [Bacteroides sp.]
MCKFSEDTKSKLGNAIIYIANNTTQLSKTKLLKLLYLMEEEMVLHYHVPFLGLPYEVWQAGPVSKDVFIDLSDGPYLLKDYVTTEQTADGKITYIKAKAEFCDDEFSDCEIEMMDNIISRYGSLTAGQLVNETHKQGTLWHKVAEAHNLIEPFEKRECNNSDYQIDFSDLLSGKAAEAYRESLDIRQTANIMKTYV